MMKPNEEQIRRYGMFALVAFNIVVLFWVLLSYFTFTPWTEKLSNGQQVIHDFSVFSAGFKGAFLGLLAGAATFYVGWKMNL